MKTYIESKHFTDERWDIIARAMQILEESCNTPNLPDVFRKELKEHGIHRTQPAPNWNKETKKFDESKHTIPLFQDLDCLDKKYVCIEAYEDSIKICSRDEEE